MLSDDYCCGYHRHKGGKSGNFWLYFRLGHRNFGVFTVHLPFALLWTTYPMMKPLFTTFNHF